MKEWFQLAFQPSVVKRALKYALVVGFILIAINDSDAILSGQITRGVLLKMLLTVMVPYGGFHLLQRRRFAGNARQIMMETCCYPGIYQWFGLPKFFKKMLASGRAI